MDKSRPPRPNLDHLRRQAKSLLAALAAGDRDAVDTVLKHLPAAKGMSKERLRTAGFRLADAQSAIARHTGFAGWPQLARHVEQLRSLEGTWEFESLEIDANQIPAAAMSSSRLLIDGDRFRTESPEAIYEGIFNINVEAAPQGIDIEFIAGPEAGNWNYGIFRLERDSLTLCLDMTGKGRPAGFRTSAGSGHALETLRRASQARPASVTGGTPPTHKAHASGLTDAPPADPAGFEHAPSPTLDRLQGDWIPAKIVLDGKELPPFMLTTGTRWAQDNEIKISFGGQMMIHARVRLNEQTDPVEVDYLLLAGAAKGSVQMGIMQWQGETACFCMGAPGKPRPVDFACHAGSGRTLSHWRPNA